jgi:hypothetical protein
MPTNREDFRPAELPAEKAKFGNTIESVAEMNELPLVVLSGQLVRFYFEEKPSVFPILVKAEEAIRGIAVFEDFRDGLLVLLLFLIVFRRECDHR